MLKKGCDGLFPWSSFQVDRDARPLFAIYKTDNKNQKKGKKKRKAATKKFVTAYT